MNQHTKKLWLVRISMRVPCIISCLVLVLLLSLACENGNASKKSGMRDLIQDRQPEERASVQDDFLAEKLSLTPQQRQELAQINSKYARQVDSILHSDDYRSRKARRFKSAMASKDRELKKLFSKEQYKMYEQIRENLKQRLRETR